MFEVNKMKTKELMDIARLSFMGLTVEVDKEMRGHDWKIVCSPEAYRKIQILSLSGGDKQNG